MTAMLSICRIAQTPIGDPEPDWEDDDSDDEDSEDDEEEDDPLQLALRLRFAAYCTIGSRNAPASLE
jgi:hypothetical protein